MTDNVIKMRLKNCRLNAGLSQRALADKLGVAPSVISGAESKRGVSKALALKLSEFFHKPSNYFFDPKSENEYINNYIPFENLNLIVSRLVDEGLIDNNGNMDNDVKGLVEEALNIDIKFLIKKKRSR